MTLVGPRLSQRYYCAKCHSEIGDADVRRGHDIVRLESWCDECREAVTAIAKSPKVYSPRSSRLPQRYLFSWW